jgi:hypothetical protein
MGLKLQLLFCDHDCQITEERLQGQLNRLSLLLFMDINPFRASPSSYVMPSPNGRSISTTEIKTPFGRNLRSHRMT